MFDKQFPIANRISAMSSATVNQSERDKFIIKYGLCYEAKCPSGVRCTGHSKEPEFNARRDRPSLPGNHKLVVTANAKGERG